MAVLQGWTPLVGTHKVVGSVNLTPHLWYFYLLLIGWSLQ